MKALLALAALALSLSAFSTRAEACGGFTPARCHCKAVGYQHMADKAVQVNIAGQDFFTFTVPNKCFNQVVDWGQYHFNKGCWLACRDAFRETRLLDRIVPGIEDMLAAGGIEPPESPEDAVPAAIPNPESLGDAGHRT